MHGIPFSVLPMASGMFSVHCIPLLPLLTKLLRNFGPCCLLVSLYYRCIYLHICKKLKRLYKHKMSVSFHGPLPCLFLRRHRCWCMDENLSGGLPLPLGKVLLLFLCCQSSFVLLRAVSQGLVRHYLLWQILPCWQCVIPLLSCNQLLPLPTPTRREGFQWSQMSGLALRQSWLGQKSDQSRHPFLLCVID